MSELKNLSEVECTMLFQDVKLIAEQVIQGRMRKLSSVTPDGRMEITAYRMFDNQVRIDIVQK